VEAVKGGPCRRQGVALLTALAALALPSAAAATYPGKPGPIAFSLQQPGVPIYWDLFTLQLGGANQPLTETADVTETDPSFSANGRRVAFTWDDGTGPEVWIMNANGGGGHALTEGPNASRSPTISPGGDRIVFVRFDGSDDELWTMDADGNGERPLTDDDLSVYDPVFSPDGRKVAFETFGGGNGSYLASIDADGGPIIPLTGPSEPGYDSWASWAPDGRRVAFYRANFNDTLRQIWIVRANGSGAHPVTRNQTGYLSHPAFSPNGSRIAFLDESSGQLQLIRPSGGAVTPTGAEIGFDPEWTPVPVRCGGRRATIVGTPRTDKLVGTGRRDVIAGLAGRDLLLGKGRNDILCGGKGGDRLLGGAGRADRCVGGPRRDVARRCERRASI
jgi:dipeptidyl aminopeptidase/acylaminoacyl peptidase